MMDAQQILEVLPHKYPFLLVDKIIEFEEGKRIVGIKNVTINEHFFTGHFPGRPIMPGVLILEAMAQVAGIMMLSIDGMKGKLAFFGGIEKAKFRRPVVPGDQLRLELEVKKIKGIVGKFYGTALVDGKVVTEGELTFSLADGGKSSQIDKTATIHPSAEIGKDVVIGPNSIIGEGVIIGNGTIIEANVVVDKWTKIGEDCHLHYGAIIGNATQDKKFAGEKSYVIIGDRNDLREYVTINRATGAGNATILGNDNLLLTHVHIAHNCELGNGIVISNAAQIAGHVLIDDNAVIGGMAGINQFIRVGKYAMVGGYSKLNQDVPPYMLVEGNPASARTVNTIGMSRGNISTDNINIIKKAYKYLYRSKLNISQAIEEMKANLEQTLELKNFIEFLQKETEKGIVKSPKSSKEE